MNVNLNGNLAEIPAKHIYVLLNRKGVEIEIRKVYLNGNLAHLLVKHINVLVTPKKQA